ncbi:MAG: hypothetical protein HRU71_14370 [Planctomycetia bacterium]|nr:MAG: hypothetical protein HRU71_14370 [Planctomycetia bacterium]
MRRARWTMLAAAGLVLMGSDGAVRSDCPPAEQVVIVGQDRSVQGLLDR